MLEFLVRELLDRLAKQYKGRAFIAEQVRVVVAEWETEG